MTVFKNKATGSPFKYDENGTSIIYPPKGDPLNEPIKFTNAEVLEFIIKNRIWDGLHHPFDVLNMKKWIMTLKIQDHMIRLPINNLIPLRDENNNYRSDYAIAKDIRKYIDRGNNP